MFYNYEGSTNAILYRDMVALISLRLIYTTWTAMATPYYTLLPDTVIQRQLILLRLGASKASRNMYGKTPAQLARKRSLVAALCQD